MTTPVPGKLVFTPRPAPASPRVRPGRRIALLLEMVDKCWGGRATLLQLHAVDTALTDSTVLDRLAAKEVSGDDGFLVRVDPALNRAVDRAVGEGLLDLQSDAKVTLTAAGRAALRTIREADVLQSERIALARIRGKLSQRHLQTAFADVT